MLPRGDEYNIAIQNPKECFVDFELKNCIPEVTPLGLPKPYSGGFTTTYHLINVKTKKEFAVRCFTRQINEVELRYDAISNFLKENQTSNYFVNANLLKKGILVNGSHFPIIKMDWVDGTPLNFFISKNIGNIKVIEQLLNDFKALIIELEMYNLGHGDLQHGNIIVKDNKMKLIDYDGMYLDSIKQLKASEIGHPNYQHPLRTVNHYDHKIDAFSSIVIFLALRAINIKPELWQKYDNGENMLFKASDFIDVDNSSLIKDLEKITPLKEFIDNFKKVRFLDFEKIPTLSDFRMGQIPKGRTIHIKNVPIGRGAYPLIDAINKEMMDKHIGQRVEIIGMVQKTYKKKDKNDDEYLLLLMGVKRSNNKYNLSLIYWPKILKTIIKLKMLNPEEFYKKWISIVGVLGTHNSLLTIEIENPSQVQILTNEDAKNKINAIKSGIAFGDLFPIDNGIKIRSENENNPWWLQNKDLFK